MRRHLFGQYIRRVKLKDADDFVDVQCGAGEEYDGERLRGGRRAELTEDFNAVHPGEADVEEHQVRR